MEANIKYGQRGVSGCGERARRPVTVDVRLANVKGDAVEVAGSSPFNTVGLEGVKSNQARREAARMVQSGEVKTEVLTRPLHDYPSKCSYQHRIGKPEQWIAVHQQPYNTRILKLRGHLY